MICVCLFGLGYPPSIDWLPSVDVPVVGVRAGADLESWFSPYIAFEQDGIPCALVPTGAARNMPVTGITASHVRRAVEQTGA